MLTTSVSLLERLRLPAQPLAWDRFVELYTPLFFRWARRLNLSDADAGDLVQEVFLIVLQKLPSFQYDPGRSFRGWLWTVANNKWRERCRGRAQPRFRGNQAIIENIAVADPVDEFAQAEHDRYLVRRALELMRAEFEPATWKACWECVVNDRAGKDVAAEFGLTINAVYLAKSRVLRKLHQELDGLLDP